MRFLTVARRRPWSPRTRAEPQRVEYPLGTPQLAPLPSNSGLCRSYNGHAPGYHFTLIFNRLTFFRIKVHSLWSKYRLPLQWFAFLASGLFITVQPDIANLALLIWRRGSHGTRHPTRSNGGQRRYTLPQNKNMGYKIKLGYLYVIIISAEYMCSLRTAILTVFPFPSFRVPFPASLPFRFNANTSFFPGHSLLWSCRTSAALVRTVAVPLELAGAG